MINSIQDIAATIVIVITMLCAIAAVIAMVASATRTMPWYYCIDDLGYPYKAMAPEELYEKEVEDKAHEAAKLAWKACESEDYGSFEEYYKQLNQEKL